MDFKVHIGGKSYLDVDAIKLLQILKGRNMCLLTSYLFL